MNLDPVLQSEVSRKEKILSIKAYIWNLKKKWYRCTHWQGRERGADIKNVLVDTAHKVEGGRRGADVKNDVLGDTAHKGEGGRTPQQSSPDLCIPPRGQQTARGKRLFCAGSSAPCSVMT